MDSSESYINDDFLTPYEMKENVTNNADETLMPKKSRERYKNRERGVKMAAFSFLTLFFMLGCVADSFSSGFHYGLPSLIITDNSTTRIDVGDGSLMTSALPMAIFLSAIMTSFTLDRYGRKMAFLCITAPGIAANMTLYFSRNIYEIFLGRFLGGLAMGSLLFLSGIIVGEYTSPKLRPAIIMFKLAILNTAILLCHILGSVIHWRYISLIGFFSYTLAFLITLTWPESPSWLAQEHRFEECIETFRWLRGEDEESKKELDEMIKKWKDTEIIQTSMKEKVLIFFKKFKQRSMLMPALIMLCMYTVREFGGKNVIPTYAIQILQSITGDKENVFFYMLAMDSVVVISNFLASSIGNKVNRRTLFFNGAGVSATLLLSMCLCLYLVYRSLIPENLSFISLVFLISYVFVQQTFVNPVTSTIVGEIYPLEHRSAGILVNGVIASLVITTSMYTMPKLLALFDVYGTFSIFAICMIIVLILLFNILPETNNRTLQEIENNFYK